MAKSNISLDGYTLAENLRKTRRRHRLSAPTQALYYELVAICNEEGWPDEFKCSNDELFAALQISEKSLISYRLELIQAGLIFYFSGKSKKKIGRYSFKKEFYNGCKFYSQSDSLSGSQSVSQSDSLSGENASDLIKTKRESKKETKPSKSHSVGKPPEKRKSFEDTTPHWKRLVDTWFVFYEQKIKAKPSFTGAAAKCLKSIVDRIEKMAKISNAAWTEDYAVRCLNHFLEKSYSDAWVKENFLLSIMSSKFDVIVNQNGTNQEKPDGVEQSVKSLLSGANW